jgi:hypothetical protein
MPDQTLYLPLNTLKPLAPGIWTVDGPSVSLDARLGLGVRFPTRMTVVQLSNGGLWCHSPTAPEAGLFAALDRLGPVEHLVSPNKLHYTHIAAWKRRYPHAVAWASPGVRERAVKRGVEIAFDADLHDDPPTAWAEDLDQLRFRGSSMMEEFVFFHRASRTLILTDLIENFEVAKLPLFLRWIGRLGGVLDPDGKTPLDWRVTFYRADARFCLAQMLAWRPQQIVLAHGRCYLQNAEVELRRAFRWLNWGRVF